MSTNSPDFAFARDRHLLVSTGAIGILGCIALLAGNIAGSLVVPNYSWVSNTVSDLAAGKYKIIQDVAFYGFAGSLIACAIGAAHFHPGGTRWNVGVLCLALLALCVIVIGARNEYGDGDNDGLIAHIYVVCAFGLLFALLFLVMAKGMAEVHNGYRIMSYCCAGLWMLGVPTFFLMPTGYDGLIERALGLVCIVWVFCFSWILVSVGRPRYRS